MADNTELNPGTGGDIIATDDVSGVKYQIVKLAVGADGAASLVENANPIPVSDAGSSLTVDNGGTFPVQATLAAETTKVIGTVNIAAAQTVAAVTAITNALPAGNNNIGDVDIASALPAGGNNIGDVDVLTVPADPFGTNADASSSTGSISAKLRFIAVTGHPITGIPTVGGTAATDAAVSGNPLYIAGRGNSGTPTAMSANNDVTPLWMTLNGAAVIAGEIIDDAAFTPGTSRVVPVGFTADETSTDSVDEGDIGAGRMTLDRKQIITPYVHAALGGHSPFRNIDVDETEDAVKATAGKLFWLHAMNMSSGVRYLKIYNATTATVVVGTTAPVLTFPIPTMADTNGAGFNIHFGDAGMQFDTAITIAATTGLADADTGAPGGNEVIVNGGFL